MIDRPYRNRVRALTRRQFVGLTGGTAAGWAMAATESTAMVPTSPLFPELSRFGDRFRFALIADTHFGSRDVGDGRDPRSHLAKYRVITSELHASDRPPAFVTHLGDIIANPNPEFVELAKSALGELKPLTMLVHGNHDGRNPWTEFKSLQRAANGTEAVTYGFNCGRWHFVVLPFEEHATDEFSDDLIEWLRADLFAHRDRPTMVFVHHHLLPQGLTQLESYTYEKPLRTRLLQTLADAGSVRWVFCGHVHNGIKASVKTAWTWREINFITAPTVVPPRNFGEEYSEFSSGQPSAGGNGGGYYLTVDIDGDQATVVGRLGGVAEQFVFPSRFRQYEDQEPLWFDNITDRTPSPTLENGSFEQSLDGWMTPYRYIADHNPGFTATVGKGHAKAGDSAAYLAVREKGQTWAHDEMTELYQWVKVAEKQSPLVRASYLIEQPDVGGGGYLRFTAFAAEDPKLTYLLDWGSGDRALNMRMALHAQFMARGEKAGATELIAMGERREALFWRLDGEPGRWHGIRLPLASAYDAVIGRRGAFAGLQIDRLLVAIGVWCGDSKGSRSEAWFDDVIIENSTSDDVVATHNTRPLPLDRSVFTTEFGAWHASKVGRRSDARRNQNQNPNRKASR